MKPILCLDFDGVIHSYTSPWEAAHIIPDPPVKGAIQFILSALEKFEVNIYSGRSHQLYGIDSMKTWLVKWIIKEIKWPDYSYTSTHHSPGYIVYNKIKWPTEKPNALVHIDDRAITFTGEWPDIEGLLSFKPWNGKEYGEGMH